MWEGEFLPFGEEYSITSTVTNNLRFPGQYYDAETGLHYNWHRDYMPEIGRYLEKDPSTCKKKPEPPYLYAAGNSLSFTDPLGLYSCYTTGQKADPDNATIVCDGAGGITVQLGWCNKKGPCLKNCCQVHETSHKNDCASQSVCAGKPAGTQVYIKEIEQSECKAYKADLECTKAALKNSKCCDENSDLQANLDSDEAQIKRFCK